MFTDARSKKIVLVAHCVLNQNAKLDRCAYYPGAVREAAELLLNSGVGLVQMPCPELLYLGLDRQTDPGTDPTVEAEDTRIAVRLQDEAARELLHRLVSELVFQVGEYSRHGFEVLGVVGANGSPSCGVETTWYGDNEHREPGVFCKLLRDELAAEGFRIPMAGIKAYEPEAAVSAVEKILAGTFT